MPNKKTKPVAPKAVKAPVKTARKQIPRTFTAQHMKYVSAIHKGTNHPDIAVVGTRDNPIGENDDGLMVISQSSQDDSELMTSVKETVNVSFKAVHCPTDQQFTEFYLSDPTPKRSGIPSDVKGAVKEVSYIYPQLYTHGQRYKTIDLTDGRGELHRITRAKFDFTNVSLEEVTLRIFVPYAPKGEPTAIAWNLEMKPFVLEPGKKFTCHRTLVTGGPSEFHRSVDRNMEISTATGPIVYGTVAQSKVLIRVVICKPEVSELTGGSVNEDVALVNMSAEVCSEVIISDKGKDGPVRATAQVAIRSNSYGEHANFVILQHCDYSELWHTDSMKYVGTTAYHKNIFPGRFVDMPDYLRIVKVYDSGQDKDDYCQITLEKWSTANYGGSGKYVQWNPGPMFENENVGIRVNLLISNYRHISSSPGGKEVVVTSAVPAFYRWIAMPPTDALTGAIVTEPRFQLCSTDWPDFPLVGPGDIKGNKYDINWLATTVDPGLIVNLAGKFGTRQPKHLTAEQMAGSLPEHIKEKSRADWKEATGGILEGLMSIISWAVLIGETAVKVADHLFQ